MTFTLKTSYLKCDKCYFFTEHYMENDGLFIGIVRDNGDDEDIDFVADVTVNIGVKLPCDCIAVKNYNENEGILEAMKALGLVTEILAYLPSGYVSIPICRYDKSVLQKYSH